MVLTAINNAFKNYYDELPNKIIPTIAQSAGISFAISILFAKSVNGTLDMSRPLLNAGVAALASTLHALATPLFNQVFGPSHTDRFFYEFIKSCIIGTLASALVGSVQQRSLQITAFKLYYMISLNSAAALLLSKGQPMPENSVYVGF